MASLRLRAEGAGTGQDAAADRSARLISAYAHAVFFVDHTQGNSIWGRITNITGLVDPNAGPAPEGSFPRAIRLVQ